MQSSKAYSVSFAQRADIEECKRLVTLEELHAWDFT